MASRPRQPPHAAEFLNSQRRTMLALQTWVGIQLASACCPKCRLSICLTHSSAIEWFTCLVPSQ